MQSEERFLAEIDSLGTNLSDAAHENEDRLRDLLDCGAAIDSLEHIIQKLREKYLLITKALLKSGNPEIEALAIQQGELCFDNMLDVALCTKRRLQLMTHKMNNRHLMVKTLILIFTAANANVVTFIDL